MRTRPAAATAESESPHRFPTLSLRVVAIVLALGDLSAPADIILGAGVQSLSPDCRRVEVNGVCMPGDGAVAWWYFDWGDGTRSSGYFPNTHRYDAPGDYIVQLHAFNDLGERADCSFDHSVPEPPSTEVARVVLARTFAGMKEGDTLSTMFTAYDAAGDALSLEGHTVEVYAPISSVLDATLNDGSLDGLALDLGGADMAMAWAYVYVDQVECDRPLLVIVNHNDGDFTGVEGDHSAFYLPDWFFDQAYVSTDDHATVMDLVWHEFAETVNFDCAREGAPQIQAVSYVPPAHGHSGNPLALGDTAGPIDGVPPFGIMFHETGHNFQARRNLLGVPAGPLYTETTAEWHVQTGCNRLLDRYAGELSLPARAALTWIRDDNRSYHAWEYDNYIAGGMVFDFGTIMPSHVLVQNIYELCDIHGWDRLRVFYRYFDVAGMCWLSHAYGDAGGYSNERALSAFVAALGLTFGEDLRPVFRPLNFPIDDAFHGAAWEALRTGYADLDADGHIGLGDLAQLLGSYGTSTGASHDDGDLDHDGDVDLSDLAALLGVYGANCP